MKRLLQHPIVQAASAKLLGLYLGFALRTTRWSLEGHEHMAPHAAGAPVVVAFWHERLPLMPMLWLKARQSPEGGKAGNRVHAGEPAPRRTLHRRGGQPICSQRGAGVFVARRCKGHAVDA